MREGHGFLIVFSLVAKSSIKELHPLHDRVLRIKDKAKVPIVLVGNKLDLVDNIQVIAYCSFVLLIFFRLLLKKVKKLETLWEFLSSQLLPKLGTTLEPFLLS